MKKSIIPCFLFFILFGSITDNRILCQETIKNDMLPVNGGTFYMGSQNNDSVYTRSEIRHQVTVSSFYMGKYQVTQMEYEKIMGINPSNFIGTNLPVEKVSWYDAIEYCNMLSQAEGLSPVYTIDKGLSDPNNMNDNDTLKWVVTWDRNANGYRLPTEAEWEYACRAGTNTPFNTGNNITTDQANYNGNYPYEKNRKGIFRGKTTDVGSFRPNRLGLFDMHGNVWEWCWDWEGPYSNLSQTDPFGAVSSRGRIYRGGSWGNRADYIRSANRGASNPTTRSEAVGFRVVRSN
jgi:formylglycine-generating enzyme required for sulfatase activity